MSILDKTSPFQFIKDALGNFKSIFTPCDLQIGTKLDPKELNLTGRLSLTPKQYQFTLQNKGEILLSNNDSVVDLTMNDVFISSALQATLYLPLQPREGQLITLKDTQNICSNKDIIVTTKNNKLIDDEQYKTLNNNLQSISLYWNDTKWCILQNSGALHSIDIQTTQLTSSSPYTLTGSNVDSQLSELLGHTNTISTCARRIVYQNSGTYTFMPSAYIALGCTMCHVFVKGGGGGGGSGSLSSGGGGGRS